MGEVLEAQRLATANLNFISFKGKGYGFCNLCIGLGQNSSMIK